MYQQLTIWSIFGILAYLFVILLAGLFITGHKYADKRLRFYCIAGLFLKLFAGIAFALLYEFHYHWEGDTFYYFRNACRLANTFFESPVSYFKILFDMVDSSNIGAIDISNYNPMVHWDNSSGRYAIHRFVSIFAIAGFNNYYMISLLMNTFLYWINWKVFCFIITLFPKQQKIAFVSFMCVPSVLLFGSGIMKDSFTLSFSGLIMVAMYRVFFERKINLKYLFLLFISLYVVFELKPYIIYAFVIAMLAWWGMMYIQKVKNAVLRLVVLPVGVIMTAIVLMYFVSAMGNLAGGRYSSIETMVESASMSQYDLKQDYYEGESFDIGGYTDVAGAVALIPSAIIAGLYRPYLWEAHSFAMAISGMENFIILFLSLYLLIKVGIRKTLSTMSDNMFLLFALLLSLILSIGIGLSTSNFAALVRFRIPLMPYFIFFILFVIQVNSKKYNTALSQK
ncbi:MAG: hypothetical protein J5701_08400 [Bacteroidales bacterium]|nr:hypothetical protein [Bacteroidales bacterium]